MNSLKPVLFLHLNITSSSCSQSYVYIFYRISVCTTNNRLIILWLLKAELHQQRSILHVHYGFDRSLKQSIFFSLGGTAHLVQAVNNFLQYSIYFQSKQMKEKQVFCQWQLAIIFLEYVGKKALEWSRRTKHVHVSAVIFKVIMLVCPIVPWTPVSQ